MGWQENGVRCEEKGGREDRAGVLSYTLPYSRLST